MSTAGSTSAATLRLLGQGRLRVATDNPGSPNIQAGLQRYPIYTTLGGTLRRRPEFQSPAAVRRRRRRSHRLSGVELTDGTSTTNDDRNYNQFGGLGRVSYDLMPGLKPFGEIDGNVRSHDLLADRNGYQRNSSGGYGAAPARSFEFSRMLTGEARGRLGGAQLRGSAAAAAAGSADVGLAGVDRDAADDGEILRHHLDRRDHGARRLRRADQHLYRGSRSRFPPLADRRSASSPGARRTIRATRASTASIRSPAI